MIDENAPILCLDVDGPLNPCPFSPERSKDWIFEPEFVSTKASGRYRLNLSRQMANAISDLGCRIMWLTTWGRHAHANMGLHFDWISHPVLAERPEPEYTGMYGWSAVEDFMWKPSAMQKLLSNPGQKVVWIDDDIEWFLSEVNKKGIVLDPHNRLLAICPESDIGITRAHIEQIKEFLK